MANLTEQVLKAENECDERIKAAKAAAVQTAADADIQARKIIEEAELKAKTLSEKIISEARKEAKKAEDEAKRRAEENAARLRSEAESKYELASKAVASMLLKIS